MQLNLQTTPFSRYGSYVALSHLPAHEDLPAGLYLRSLRGPLVGASPWQPIFHLQLLVDGSALPAEATEITATPVLLRLAHGERQVQACFETADRLRLRGSGAGLRLVMQPRGYDFAAPHADGRWQVVVCSDVETKFLIAPLAGAVAVQVEWSGLAAKSLVVDLLPDADGAGEWCIDEYVATPPGQPPGDAPAPDFAAVLQSVGADYERWRAGCLRMAGGYPDAAEAAAYVTWSCVVAPAGHLRRPAMYMSKNAMASIWSWDNCFNALALAAHRPDLAWDQLMVMVDLQDRSGVLPDLANDRFVSWSFCKPPVYGWTLQQMARTPGLLTPARLAEIYPALRRLTEWWLRQRDDNGDGIPQYNHGNESGWDNSTVFRTLPPVDSPDLAAFLVLQMEVLAGMAAGLGEREEGERWQARADGLLQKTIDCFWRGDRFVARQSGSGMEIDCDSLLLFMPLVLGRRLPASVTAPLVARLREEGHFLTEHGLASESLRSPHYQPDGYWRGPIWGAPSVLLSAALDDLGETALAAEVRRRFCDLAARRGLAENYDAASGAPLRDRAFTWTASAFLWLAAQSAKAQVTLGT
jgi:hypothetical protein